MPNIPMRKSFVSLVLLMPLAAVAQFPLPENLPDSGLENPRAKGIILIFQRWPGEQEKAGILEKTKAAGLEKTTELPRFKAWIFAWPEWQTGAAALEVCGSLAANSSLEYCEPDFYLAPADGKKSDAT